MNSDQFCELWRKEKEMILERCFNANYGSALSKLVEQINLSSDQREVFAKVVDQLLNDTFYNLLLGLDGCASIGGIQQEYKIYDEHGSLISDCGELEASAYELFQENKSNA
ncbi:MAG: hypothetical protein Sw1PiTSA_21880 [Shewanella algae]|uniref:hypothetical protein n=1 Tax=Shewanella algae TaxID=38313 RepID=UPI00046AA317|nr:hypothetical protein [Shewanella algae]MBO2619044.1 hypothetical protein [Shewanella algae]NKZ41461.1 hypothetical protein [Shewanella algae]PSS69339.1 hypothetical protein AYI85_11455 [Shewanella algae]QTE78770.1 hypothetical protein E1N14_003695 [Shewanella algae]TVK99558.1 hypothetical protein AYI84_18510 [Shewanella algae]